MFHPLTLLAYYEPNKELKIRFSTYGYSKSNPKNSQTESKSSKVEVLKILNFVVWDFLKDTNNVLNL